MNLTSEQIKKYQQKLLLSRFRILNNHGLYGLLLMHMKLGLDLECAAVPQLVADYLSQFRDQLVIDFETYFNGEKMHHDDIEKAIADILDKPIMKTSHELKITF